MGGFRCQLSGTKYTEWDLLGGEIWPNQHVLEDIWKQLLVDFDKYAGTSEGTRGCYFWNAAFDVLYPLCLSQWGFLFHPACAFAFIYGRTLLPSRGAGMDWHRGVVEWLVSSSVTVLENKGSSVTWPTSVVKFYFSKWLRLTIESFTTHTVFTSRVDIRTCLRWNNSTHRWSPFICE